MNYKIFNGTTLINTVTTKKVDIAGLQPLTKYSFGVQSNNGLRDGIKKTIDVTTRGARFTIPKTITAGTNITLRYVEYPFGSVPIGNERSGYFGGGGKADIGAKVVSTANGSSVIEITDTSGKVNIGGSNIITNGGIVDPGKSTAKGWRLWGSSSNSTGATREINFAGPDWPIGNIGLFKLIHPNVGQWGFAQDDVPVDSNKTYTLSVQADGEGIPVVFVHGNAYDDKPQRIEQVVPSGGKQLVSYTFKPGSGATRTNIYVGLDNGIGTVCISRIKLEVGSVPTPFGAFVDGSTFTKQSDGKFALFTDYKALYY